MTEVTNYQVATGVQDLASLDRTRFLERRRNEGINSWSYELKAVLATSDSLSDVTSQVRNLVFGKDTTDVRVITFNRAGYMFNDHLFVTVFYEHSRLEVQIIGSKDCKVILDKLKENLDVKEELELEWWFFTPDGNDYRVVTVDVTNNTSSIHYPYIKPSLDKFLEDYHKSPSSILLLMGEPGTGKTSFIRHYMNKFKLRGCVTYDERVMHSDEFYIDFITNNRMNLMVVEDADIMLTSRERDSNKIMSKLLNVSDGLVKIINKKIIFTTNLQNVNQIDHALIRPGRCYDILQFRKLDLDEANVIRKAEGLPLFESGREFSLAEIYSNHLQSTKQTKIGF